MTTPKHVLVLAGVGNGGGTGGAVARLFAKEGFAIALVARGADALNKFSDDIIKSGGEAAAFQLNSYSADDITAVWASIKQRFTRPSYEIRAAVWNVGYGGFKKFMDVTPDDIMRTAEANMIGAFPFSQQAITTFQENTIEPESGARGTLIFTGATASIRGNIYTSVFSAGKFALRALSQSLNKIYGKENIHVAHVVIDGMIDTDRLANDPEAVRLGPDSISKSYLFLVKQDELAWTWELDLRPAHEKW